MAKVLVYGSGGRDHCLAEKYGDSQHVDKVFFAPGNPGVLYTPKGKRGLIELVNLSDSNDFNEVATFCQEQKVDLVDIGSENPLSSGLVDALNRHNIPTVGPKQEYVRIESLSFAQNPACRLRQFFHVERLLDKRITASFQYLCCVAVFAVSA